MEALLIRRTLLYALHLRHFFKDWTHLKSPHSLAQWLLSFQPNFSILQRPAFQPLAPHPASTRIRQRKYSKPQKIIQKKKPALQSRLNHDPEPHPSQLWDPQRIYFRARVKSRHLHQQKVSNFTNQENETNKPTKKTPSKRWCSTKVQRKKYWSRPSLHWTRKKLPAKSSSNASSTKSTTRLCRISSPETESKSPNKAGLTSQL